MFCITLRKVDEPHRGNGYLAPRLSAALPGGLRLRDAYVDEQRVVIYVEADVDAHADVLIDHFIARLGLELLAKHDVDALPIHSTSGDAALASPVELADIRRAELIETATTSIDGRTIVATVRHKPHEQIDRVDVKEQDETVEVTVWVGCRADEPRRHYATFGEQFSTVPFVLNDPLGTRRIIDGH